MKMESQRVRITPPEVRQAYEAALGAFILKHNEADYLLSISIRSFAELYYPENLTLQNLCDGDFARRLDALAILKGFGVYSEFERIDIDALRQLNGDRNTVAHHHFEQDWVLTGEYVLVSRRRGKPHDTSTNFSIERLIDCERKLEVIVDNLRVATVVLEHQLGR